eukprot:TRINITY_DN6671_c0_g1_i1.p1 TRINITY_DN6671_c0_g1~~TRINITY_DN6671_c0_g1_i1.p1  ORF type:complete len:371 (-),score=61.78 TRINITY_DN6671_c0_g1_i1:39-1151(-)
MSKCIRIGFIGAGQVNFGSDLKEPWDHASRIEKIPNVRPVAIVEPDRTRAEAVLKQREQNKPEFWKDVKIFASVEELIQAKIVDAVFIGIPPFAHGKGDSIIETMCAKAGIHMFIEKPLSCLDPADLVSVKDSINSKPEIVVSVGYMFRYSKAIRTMKEIISKHNTKIRSVILRYNCSYVSIPKLFWWDKTQSGGPIVEQATHFCDISRYLCGEVNLSSIRAQSINHDEPLGKLSNIPVDEEKIKPENRIPRFTTCFWRFENGAIGTLTHGLLLHGTSYDTYIEVWCDGLQLILEDPYNKCKLTVRGPNSDAVKVLDLSWATTGDDPYFNEDLAFFEAIWDPKKRNEIQNYEDALKTYQLTWAIRKACEQ